MTIGTSVTATVAAAWEGQATPALPARTAATAAVSSNSAVVFCGPQP